MHYFYNLKNLNTLKNTFYIPIYFSDIYSKYYNRFILNINQSIIDNGNFTSFNQVNFKALGYSFIINQCDYSNNYNKMIKFKYLNKISIFKKYLDKFYNLLNINCGIFIILSPKRNGFKVYSTGIVGFLPKIEIKSILHILYKTNVFSIIKNKFLVVKFFTTFFKLKIKLLGLKNVVNRFLKKKKRNLGRFKILFCIKKDLQYVR